MLDDFVVEAKAIVARRLEETRTLRALPEPLSRIIARSDCLADMEPAGNPDPDKGFTIYRAEDLTILAVVWPKNGGAPIHNHNGWAIEGVISGLERNRNYARLDDGETPWHANMPPQSERVSSSAVGPNQDHRLAKQHSALLCILASRPVSGTMSFIAL